MDLDHYSTIAAGERARLGLSLRAIADIAGTNHQTVATFLAGERTQFDTVLSILAALGLRLTVEPADG